MSKSNFENVPQIRDIPSTVFIDLDKKATYLLSKTLRSQEKMTQRTKWLEKHPQDRITIDQKPLQEIIPYEVFLCHPDCSVARNEAINGSDIDAGLVITKMPVSLQEKHLFIEELKKQGFNAYYNISEMQNQDIQNQGELITFLTVDEINAQLENEKTFTKQEMIYRAGFKIK